MDDKNQERVDVELAGGVLTLTLTRPEAGNAIDLAMAEALRDAAERIAGGARDGSVRAVVLRAAGRAFCVGGDLRHFAEADDRSAEMRRVVDAIHTAIRTLAASPVPVVTAIQGVAAGGGFGLALTGDILVAGRAARFKVAYTAAGLAPDCGTSWGITRRVGLSRALDLALTNRLVTADEALATALVSRVVDDAELDAEVSAIATALAAGATDAQARTRALIHAAATTSLSDQLDLEADAIVSLVDTPDGREGVAAFLEKRAASFGAA